MANKLLQESAHRIWLPQLSCSSTWSSACCHLPSALSPWFKSGGHFLTCCNLCQPNFLAGRALGTRFVIYEVRIALKSVLGAPTRPQPRIAAILNWCRFCATNTASFLSPPPPPFFSCLNYNNNNYNNGDCSCISLVLALIGFATCCELQRVVAAIVAALHDK